LLQVRFLQKRRIAQNVEAVLSCFVVKCGRFKAPLAPSRCRNQPIEADRAAALQDDRAARRGFRWRRRLGAPDLRQPAASLGRRAW
jgi:hypothetical protein